MIDFYGYITTMSWRVGITLEELGLDYRFHPIHLGRGEQHDPAHRARNPMQKVPVIIDHDPADGGQPVTLFESAAILVYLAEKTGRLLPSSALDRADFWTWFFWVVNSYGEALGLCGGSFHRDARYRLFDPVDYGAATYERFTEASIQVHYKLDQRLEGRSYICGDYSLADMACWPWVITYKSQGISLDEQFPNVRRWYDLCKQRPGLRRGYQVGREHGKPGQMDPKAKEILLGQKPAAGEAGPGN